VIHLILSLHETQSYRQKGRTRLECMMMRLGVVPPYPEEEEVGSVWVVLPGRSVDEYEAEGIEITGPVPGAKARLVLDRLRATFEGLGFAVVTVTDYP
jgi:hypothetical protein